MKRTFHILLSTACLFLSACGAVQQAQLNSSIQGAQLEIANKCSPLVSVSVSEASAWADGSEKMKQCFDGVSEPWGKDQKTQQAFQCGTQYMNEHIKPVSYSQDAFKTLMKERDEQEQAYMNGQLGWEDFNRRGQERITKYFQKANTGSYFNFANCQNTVFQQMVMPLYTPQLRPLLIEWMTNTLSFSRQADQSKIQIADYQVGMQKLWSDFATKEQRAIGAYNAQNQQAWQNYSQSLREYSNQLMQNQAAQEHSIKNTDCQFIGNQMQCRSW